jgi:hypothetical protein
LDLVVISAIAVGNFRKPQEPLSVDGTAGATHGHLTSLFVGACVLWNLYCFVFLARFAFPNFWVERAATLSGDCLGHSYLGLLFARTLDPTMDTPVPAAYLFKLMLFFIPSTGEKVRDQSHPTHYHIVTITIFSVHGYHHHFFLPLSLCPDPQHDTMPHVSNAQNSIVVALMEQHGQPLALLVCLFVVAAWLLIHERFFSNRCVRVSVVNAPQTDANRSRWDL